MQRFYLRFHSGARPFIIDKALFFDGLSIGHGNLVRQGEKGGKIGKSSQEL